MLRVAIDGTASAGKGSIAKGVSRQLQLPYVDTGAMYRSVALLLKRKGKAFDQVKEIEDLLSNISFDFFWQQDQLRILMNNEDVSEQIRTEEVGRGASIVSAIPMVRASLSEIQKEYARSSSLVMDGRDIATVIIPDAELKVFVDADIKERATRRHTEMLKKGIHLEWAAVLKDLQERDNRDMTRVIAPLKKDSNARLLDTTNISIQEGIDLVYAWALDILKT